MHSGIIENICLEGARISGVFSKTFKSEDLLSPATLTLRLERGDVKETIVIPEISVKRVEERSDEEIALGVHFQLKESDKTRLDNFISLCNMLEASSSKKKK